MNLENGREGVDSETGFGDFGYLMGGTALVELIFGIPGLGSLTITSICSKDILQTTAYILFLVALSVVIMLLVDLLYAYVNLRVKE